jgi:hypothetical protein
VNSTTFRLSLALIGLVGLLALLTASVLLARAGHSLGAALTGTGAGGLAISGLYTLLRELSRP